MISSSQSQQGHTRTERKERSGVQVRACGWRKAVPGMRTPVKGDGHHGLNSDNSTATTVWNPAVAAAAA
jgi:hypothetical protein